MKLSDFKGEDAILVMADLLEPISKILGNKDTADFFSNATEKGSVSTIKFAQFLLKNHSTEVLEIFAILDNVDIVNDIPAFVVYKQSINPIVAMTNLVNLLNDEAMINLFQYFSRRSQVCIILD